MALHPETPAEGQTLTDLSSGRGFDVEAAQGRIAELVRIVPERHAVIVLTAPGRDETPIGKLLAVDSYRSQVAQLRVKSKIRRKAKCRERQHMI